MNSHNSSIEEVIDFKTCANFNISKHFVVETFRNWGVNKFEKLMKPSKKSIHATFSSYFSPIDREKVDFSQILQFMTCC